MTQVYLDPRGEPWVKVKVSCWDEQLYSTDVRLPSTSLSSPVPSFGDVMSDCRNANIVKDINLIDRVGYVQLFFGFHSQHPVGWNAHNFAVFHSALHTEPNISV